MRLHTENERTWSKLQHMNGKIQKKLPIIENLQKERLFSFRPKVDQFKKSYKTFDYCCQKLVYSSFHSVTPAIKFKLYTPCKHEGLM